MKNKNNLLITILFFGGIVVVWILYCDYKTMRYESIKKLQDLSETLKHDHSTTIDSLEDSIRSQPCPICSDTVWRDSLRKTIIEKRKREINNNN